MLLGSKTGGTAGSPRLPDRDRCVFQMNMASWRAFVLSPGTARKDALTCPAGRPRRASSEQAPDPSLPPAVKARSLRCSSSPHETRLRWAFAGAPGAARRREVTYPAGRPRRAAPCPPGTPGRRRWTRPKRRLRRMKRGRVEEAARLAAPRGAGNRFAATVGRRRQGSYLSSRQATPGSSLPSRNSREAPPPVEIWVILSA